MFIHGKTGVKYYSIREKINYYTSMLKNKDLPLENRQKAIKRLSELKDLNNRSFDEPELVVVDDKKFGNGISKPRLCVVVGHASKNRLVVASMNHRVTNSIILDNYLDRQIDERKRLVDYSDIYETKYIQDVQPLTVYDKRKIRNLYKNE